MKGYSTQQPENAVPHNGGWQYRFNIAQVTRTDDEGVEYIEWEYDYINSANHPSTRAAYEEIVTALIQNEVDKYNKANDVLFRDVHSCKSYADMTGYEHQAFCLGVFTWNLDVWQAVRQILADVKAGTRQAPTIGEFLTELPVFVQE
jgi:hypothetical protein